MDGQPVNLRRARKARARQEASEQAQANRLAFGRPKAERAATTAERELQTRWLEAHLRAAAPRSPASDAGE